MSSEFGYGAAVDAGSSGSRVYLYRWPKPKKLDKRPRGRVGEPAGGSSADEFVRVEREAIFSEERTPGVAHHDGAGISVLEELVSIAKTALPPGVDPADVPIYLGATAGMRIVDPAFRDDVMSRIRSLLHGSGFLFRDDWARIISGVEEGVYDWLVANYLKNGGDFPAPKTAYGALDLGGASTQISFPLSDRAVSGEDPFPLRIDNMEYPLYTQSFLYYGVNQARMKYDAEYASVTKPNPCYPFGYKDPISNVAGSSNWNTCLEGVAQLFEQEAPTNCGGDGLRHPHHEHRCLGGTDSGPIHQLPIEQGQKFIAMSAFVYTWDFLNLTIGEQTDDLATLDSRAQKVCNLTHRQQMERYRQHVEEAPDLRKLSRPWDQCFNAAFSYHLLSKGYGLPVKNTPIEIHYDIGGVKVQWALGLMLVEANKLRYLFKELGRGEIDRAQLDLYSGILLMMSIAILLVFAWALGYIGPKRRKRAPADVQEESCLPLIDPNAVVETFSPRKGR